MPKDPPRRNLPTTESTAFLSGLYQEFLEQSRRYHDMNAHLLEMTAKVELAEKQICLTRDHLLMVAQRTEGAIPQDWNKTLQSVRFVGVRLADACVALLRERRKLKHQELLDALNLGMYRFRTNTPFREIHGALLRQRQVKRTDEGWEWIGPDKNQMPLRLVKPRAEKA